MSLDNLLSYSRALSAAHHEWNNLVESIRKHTFYCSRESVKRQNFLSGDMNTGSLTLLRLMFSLVRNAVLLFTVINTK